MYNFKVLVKVVDAFKDLVCGVHKDNLIDLFSFFQDRIESTHIHVFEDKMKLVLSVERAIILYDERGIA